MKTDALKILHVYKDYHPIIGGIENHIKHMAEAQVKAGHQVTVLVTNPGDEAREEIINGVRVIRSRRLATVASTPLSLDLPRRLSALDPDITHLQFPYPVGEISQLFLGHARPFVISYQSDVINPRQQMILKFYDPFLQRILQRADRILATSQQYIRSSPYLAPLADKCEIVPIGIDPQPFLAAPAAPPPGEIPTLLFVGRHRYYKGLSYLLQAMPDIPARLLVAGDGPMRSIWQAQARDLGLGDRVSFLGDVPDDKLIELYASADIFVLPSHLRSEAYGIVLLEAMASSRPCVVTELGTGTSFLVQDGETGLVVPPEQPQALAQAINRLLADEALRLQMGAAGRQRVLDNFTLEQMTQRVATIYRQILTSQSDNR